LLRELDYSEDFDIAELEIELEEQGKLDAFIKKCNELFPKEGWQKVRKSATRISRASRVLHEIDKANFKDTDSWAHTQKGRDTAVNVRKVVERTFELWGRRRKGKALVFIIDEVGQHVARSGDKIEDLRATVEEFGKVGKNLLKAHKIKAPCWIVVTSQEKLDEVVAAIDDSKRVDLAKLQDRFRNRVDLAPSDIREVATKRVLAKKPGDKSTDAIPVLRKLFSTNEGTLNDALHLERTNRPTEINEEDFIQFYPYPPHYIDLCIGIMSGIRLQPGAPRHYGGSNRTIIKQAYEMLVSPRTEFAKKPIGSLVTLDKVFELVEGNLSTEKQRDINDISQRFKKDAEDKGWALRVGKAICLLEFIRDLPRTEANLAAFLVDEVGQPAPIKEVQAAVKRLHGAKFIRSTEDGWKLQTAQEKSWETKRQQYLRPKPKERNDIIRQTLQHIFDEPEFKTYRHQNFRSFRIGINLDGFQIGDEGDIPLMLSIADDAEDFSKLLEQTKDKCRPNSPQENDLYWLFCLTTDIDEVVAQLHASRRMVEEYDQLRAQTQITTDEAACLQDEKNSVLGLQTRLRDKLTEAIEKGTGVFRSVPKDAASLGHSLAEILKKLFSTIVPYVYPKLEIGARPLRADDTEQFLKAADLKALPTYFYPGDKGLSLVIPDGAKKVINTSATVVKEVFDYLKSEHSYGNKDTRMGKALERRFTGIGYGWEGDMVRLVLAVLFRAGEIEVTYQGNRYHNYQDPVSRIPFTKTPAFRASLFSPRQSVGLKTLTLAVQQLEDLTGEEVDVEEGAIATAFKKVAGEEMEKLHPLKALAEAHRLPEPVLNMLTEYQQTLLGIQASASDDCVRILTETGAIFSETLEKVRKLREALNDEALAIMRQARTATEHVWQRFAAHSPAPEVSQAVIEVKALLASEQVVQSVDTIAAKAKLVLDAYKQAYLALFDRRAETYQKALEEIKNRPEWEPLEKTNKDLAVSLLSPLVSRIGSDADRAAVANGTGLGQASLTEMESDLAAVDGLKSSVLVKLQELFMGGDKKSPIRRVKVSEFFNRPIQTQQDLDAALTQLRDSLQKYIDEGAAIILE
jgi:hypothetical protein